MVLRTTEGIAYIPPMASAPARRASSEVIVITEKQSAARG